jgi:hypothetical protein
LSFCQGGFSMRKRDINQKAELVAVFLILAGSLFICLLILLIIW